MRILYAADNKIGSYFQMKRFLSSVEHKNHIIKVAGYKRSIRDLWADSTLDCLLNFVEPDSTLSFNYNYNYYCNEIKKFKPDLIISDLEIYTSLIAIELGIKLWQYSPNLIYYALPNDIIKNINIDKYYHSVFQSNTRRKDYIRYILNNSDKKYVSSYLSDYTNRPTIYDGFEYVRPNFLLEEKKKTISYFFVSEKNTNTFIKNDEIRLSVHNENFEDIYSDNIVGCKYFISDGTPVFLADGFYNQKYNYIHPKYDDAESIIHSYLSEYFDTGKIIDDNTSFNKETLTIKLDEKIKFLSQLL
jgi:hypothetical protein